MSTQILTELPNIQKAGMDYQTVLSEIHRIVQDNPNWKENWSSFYSSEAGALLTELMAWIADNLATRQDLIHNEMFIGTAQNDSNKIKHLKHIGYIPQMPHAAKVPIVIQFDKIVTANMYLTQPRGSQLILRPNDIAKLKSKDINGREITWEIIKMKDGKPSYLDSIMLSPGQTEYREDSEGNELFALQGNTVCEEFNAETNDGSYFNLKEKNISADSIQVYITKTTAKLLEVNSFVSKDALDKSLPIPYVLELNNDQTYRIRFGNRDVLHVSRLLPAGTTISVFYRTCDGMLGNINPGFMDYSVKYRTEFKETFDAHVRNNLPANGGTNQESLNSAVLNGPLSLKTMDRAVTPEDYNIILDRNTNIFKVKTYTATNQPDGFKNYYGRYINPQETFSFVMLNKNYKGVPTSKYNYFPWFTSNLEPRLNEKYVFDSGNYNLPVKASQTLYNVKVMENGGGTRSFKNATILDLGDIWNSSLYDAGGNPNLFLKGKITTSPTENKFFDNIKFSLFNDRDLSYIGLKNKSGDDNYYLSMDDNARFISKPSFDITKPIDVIKNRYLNIIADGILNQTIDLWSADQFDVNKMPANAYLMWSNEPEVDPSIYKEVATKDAAKNRYGIVELINMSLNNACGDDGEFHDLKDTSNQFYGIDYINNENELTLKNIVNEPFINVSIKMKDNIYVFTLTKEYANTKFKSYPWGSLKCLAEYLNWSFLNGKTGVGENTSIKKFEGSDLVDLTEDEVEELKGYSVESRIRTIFDSDYEDDIDDKDYNSTRTLYDLVIYNKPDYKESLLTSINFTDDDGFSHRLINVIDVSDPNIDPTLSDGTKYIGLGFYVRGAKCSRTSKHYPHPIQAADYSNMASLQLLEDNECRLKIISPTMGESSTICFQKLPGYTDFGQKVLGISYDSDGYSNKAYGVKRAYLMRNDSLSVTMSENGTYYDSGISVNRGNIIFENSCINNNGDFEQLYCSFKVRANGSLEIGSKYENFYYTGTVADEEMKEPVSGIVGEHMDFTILPNGQKKYFLNEEKSDFDIRFTSTPQNTNSLYSIKEDLDIVRSDKVRFLSNDIVNLKKDVPGTLPSLIIQFDNEPKLTVPLWNCNNGKDIIKEIRKSITVGGSEMLKQNINSVVKSSYENSNRIVFTGNKKNNGMIKFMYDKRKTDEENQFLYKQILGTNMSNSDFYQLYPKDDVPKDNIFYTEGGEYYYSPTVDKNLIFVYKKMVYGKENGVESRFADYYLNVEKVPVGDQFKYKFYITKTEESKFPDKEFYVNFINDKSYNFDKNGKLKETDDTILQNYMYKYKISGTDVTFVQPYFNTYDVAATIKYNANFSETEIVQSVRKAVDEVCDLKYAEIAGSMSRAKIFKAIMNCDGVEDCKITYFGDDYSSGKGNCEVMQAQFYEILCLHEDEDNKRGKIFTFEINN